MAQTPSNFDESTLTKGQLRKLNALRKSVGDEVGERAFSDWLAAQPAAETAKTDRNAQAIADALWPLAREGTLTFPRGGGYLVRRGRGRIVIEPAKP